MANRMDTPRSETNKQRAQGILESPDFNFYEDSSKLKDLGYTIKALIQPTPTPSQCCDGADPTTLTDQISEIVAAHVGPNPALVADLAQRCLQPLVDRAQASTALMLRRTAEIEQMFIDGLVKELDD